MINSVLHYEKAIIHLVSLLLNILPYYLKPLQNFKSPGFSVTSVESDDSNTPVGSLVKLCGDGTSTVGMSDSYQSGYILQSPSSSSVAANSMCTVVSNTASTNTNTVTETSSTTLSTTNLPFMTPSFSSSQSSLVPVLHAKNPDSSLSSLQYNNSPCHMNHRSYSTFLQAELRLKPELDNSSFASV